MAITITQTFSSCASSRLFLITIDGYFTIYTTVTSHPLVVHWWLIKCLSCRPRLVFGLDIQWTPYGGPHPAAILSLCVGQNCLIFQLRHSPYSPYILHWLLSHPKATLVGFHTKYDSRKLSRSHHRLQLLSGIPIDLTYFATNTTGESLRNQTIPDILFEVLEIDIDWDFYEVSASDWDVEELSVAQIKHACVYAYAAYRIGFKFRAWEHNPTFSGSRFS